MQILDSIAIGDNCASFSSRPQLCAYDLVAQLLGPPPTSHLHAACSASHRLFNKTDYSNESVRTRGAGSLTRVRPYQEREWTRQNKLVATLEDKSETSTPGAHIWDHLRIVWQSKVTCMDNFTSSQSFFRKAFAFNSAPKAMTRKFPHWPSTKWVSSDGVICFHERDKRDGINVAVTAQIFILQSSLLLSL